MPSSTCVWDAQGGKRSVDPSCRASKAFRIFSMGSACPICTTLQRSLSWRLDLLMLKIPELGTGMFSQLLLNGGECFAMS